MLDVVHALHTGFPTHISTTELSIKMPSSPRSFAHMYSRLNGDIEDALDIAPDAEDTLLLLLGLLSDLIYLETSFEILSPDNDDLGYGHLQTGAPHSYSSLSPDIQFSRLKDRISRTLYSWDHFFASTAPPDLLALFYYCKLRMSCENMGTLPTKAAYAATNELGKEDAPVNVTEEAVNLAWQVLDHVNVRTKDVSARTAIWLPVVLFHASLVVWHGLSSSSSNIRGSLRMLEPFTSELRSMPWPCCVEMVATLDRLVAQPSLPGRV